MNVSRKRVSVLLLLVLWAFVIFSFSFSHSQEALPQDKRSQEKQKEPERIVPGPKDIKERLAIYVFVGWVWLSIAVLLYILRQKIREADRIFKLKFFLKEKD